MCCLGGQYGAGRRGAEETLLNITQWYLRHYWRGPLMWVVEIVKLGNPMLSRLYGTTGLALVYTVNSFQLDVHFVIRSRVLLRSYKDQLCRTAMACPLINTAASHRLYLSISAGNIRAEIECMNHDHSRALVLLRRRHCSRLLLRGQKISAGKKWRWEYLMSYC